MTTSDRIDDMSDLYNGHSRHFVATTTMQRFVHFCDENGLDSRAARYVRRTSDLQGHRGGKLTILPDFTEDWQELRAYATAHGIEVVVL